MKQTKHRFSATDEIHSRFKKYPSRGVLGKDDEGNVLGYGLTSGESPTVEVVSINMTQWKTIRRDDLTKTLPDKAGAHDYIKSLKEMFAPKIGMSQDAVAEKPETVPVPADEDGQDTASHGMEP